MHSPWKRDHPLCQMLELSTTVYCFWLGHSRCQGKVGIAGTKKRTQDKAIDGAGNQSVHRPTERPHGILVKKVTSILAFRLEKIIHQHGALSLTQISWLDHHSIRIARSSPTSPVGLLSLLLPDSDSLIHFEQMILAG